ncbi:MAG TPA: tetratricopeptide repeat protein [Verrucomicrobiae bacterium]|nr:tetratricopeptide repeat protein [Verrucomicrobiae bacterium]
MKDAWKAPAAGAALIILLTVVAYLPALRGGFIWDDDSYVTDNPTLRSLGGLEAIWFRPGVTYQYYPLVFTSFWAEYHLWGVRPFGYHLVNVLLHAANAVLLWRVLRRLGIAGSWWAAAIFALHPVTVESVAWVTERKNTLSGLFYLLAALAWLRFRPLTAGEPARKSDWRFYWLALGLFVCALLSKTVTCSLPAVLLLLIWWKTGRLERRDGLALAPWFVLGAVAGFMTRWMEQHLVAVGTDWNLSFVQRCLIAGRALWFYAGKLCWPRHLTFIYPHWEIDAGAAWQYSYPLAAVMVLVALWSLRARIGKGPLVAVLFFGITLAPALGFINVYPFRYSYVADHFQYLAGIGLIALAVGACAAVFQQAGQRCRGLGPLAGSIVLLLLGTATWGQAHAYRDLETLWRDTVAKNPDAWLAHNNLGTVFRQADKPEEAIEQFQQALQIKPDLAEAHYNLGVTLAQLDRFQEAIGHYDEALRLKPDFAEAHYNLGVALAESGRVPEAMKHWEQALRIKPDYAEAHFNLGLMLAAQGRTTEASQHYRKALDLAIQKGNTTLANAVRSKINS